MALLSFITLEMSDYGPINSSLFLIFFVKLRETPMACTEASSASLPEPLPATGHQDKKDQFSDLMPAERGGLELSEPVKCSPHQGSEFQAVTTGGMNYAGI